MAYELKELQGSFFTNNRKEKETHPDFTGEAKVNGKVYWVSAWEKTDKNGKPWFSFALKEKDLSQARKATEQTPQRYPDEAPF